MTSQNSHIAIRISHGKLSNKPAFVDTHVQPHSYIRHSWRHAVGHVQTAVRRVSAEQVKSTHLLATLISRWALEQLSSSIPPFTVSPLDDSHTCTFHCPVKPQEEASISTGPLSEKPLRMNHLKPQAKKSQDNEQAMQVYAQKSTAQCQD